MNKKEKMSPTEARAYLRGVLDVWGDWSKHHRRLVEAIVILLQEVEGREAQIKQYRHCNEELFERNKELEYDIELLKQEKSVVIVEAITEFATRFNSIILFLLYIVFIVKNEKSPICFQKGTSCHIPSLTSDLVTGIITQ